jgi:phenylacetate-coenzyme A ligase PaaK-like adenylate-forming protein
MTAATTPLDAWISRSIGVLGPLVSKGLAAYQLARLRETIRWARERSPFYAKRLRGVEVDAVDSREALASLPFTTSEDVAREAPRMLCVSQGAVARVVTLESSGTSGAPKRLFFSGGDLERALDFFAHGVATFAGQGDAMLIALPVAREGSVGNLLADGIERGGVRAIRYGLIGDASDAVETMARERATSIIGFPVQLLELAEQRGVLAERVLGKVRSVVPCSDAVSPALLRRLRGRIGGEVFEHYGMTEMGLGGGIECAAHCGYHMREADLLVEIVDPQSGRAVADGERGEVVFSTLTREAMPLIRYRTGDVSSWSPLDCRCGSELRNLRRIRERVGGAVALGGCGTITMAELDDALFAVAGVMDFRAAVTGGSTAELCVACKLAEVEQQRALRDARRAVEGIAVVAAALGRGELRLRIEAATVNEFRGAKRRIEVAER